MAYGWFGKIPALGDFATRRLPLSFVTRWDEWLSDELADLRAQWGCEWSARYRRAPTLCFAIDAEVIDGRAWHGILVPSYDRVGREFPLTLAQNRAAAPREREWWAGLVATAGRALQPGCGAADFERAVEEFFARSREEENTPAPEPLTGWWRWCDGDWPGLPRARATELPRGEQFRMLLEAPPGA